jgi:hypothetical protein
LSSLTVANLMPRLYVELNKASNSTFLSMG